MVKVLRAIAASVIAAAVVAGCAGHAAKAHGSLTGVFLMVGGPADIAHPNGVRVPLPGHVIASNVDTGEHFTVSTGKSGRFTMLLAPGTYNLTGFMSTAKRCAASRRVLFGSRLANAYEALTSSVQCPDHAPMRSRPTGSPNTSASATAISSPRHGIYEGCVELLISASSNMPRSGTVHHARKRWPVKPSAQPTLVRTQHLPPM
jgi:hypothetical protein